MNKKLTRQVIHKTQKLERTKLEVDQLEQLNEKLEYIDHLFRRLKH